VEFFKTIEKTGIVPILPFFKKEDVSLACKAARESGVPVVEILQRGKDSEKALEAAAKEFPDVSIGAGSVLDIEQCKRLLDKGASFIVSPGFNEKLVSFCLEKKVPVIPGTITPSEIQMAVNLGLTILKFFPFFQMGGTEMISIISGPFPNVRFIATGCLEFKHLNEIMSCNKIFASGGVWMFCDEDNPQRKEYNDMVKILRDSVELIQKIRKKF